MSTHLSAEDNHDEISGMHSNNEDGSNPVKMSITLQDFYVLDGASKCFDLRQEIKNQGGQAVYAGKEFIGWRINKIHRRGPEYSTLTGAGLKMQPIPGSERAQPLN